MIRRVNEEILEDLRSELKKGYNDRISDLAKYNDRQQLTLKAKVDDFTYQIEQLKIVQEEI